jgi:hypothetical protein
MSDSLGKLEAYRRSPENQKLVASALAHFRAEQGSCLTASQVTEQYPLWSPYQSAYQTLSFEYKGEVLYPEWQYKAHVIPRLGILFSGVATWDSYTLLMWLNLKNPFFDGDTAKMQLLCADPWTSEQTERFRAAIVGWHRDGMQGW